MKITIMKCPVCGKEFYTEYYSGGYIDHVLNWVGNYKNILAELEISDKYPEYINKIIDEITIDNLQYRDIEDINARKVCFFKWLKNKKVETNIISKIDKLVSEKIKHIEQINSELKNIKNLIDKHDNYIDREHIVRNLHA